MRDQTVGPEVSSRMRPAHVSDATLRRVTFAVLLTSPAFVVAVAVLIVNDWLLKPALGNWLSGKLSDVAGSSHFRFS